MHQERVPNIPLRPPSPSFNSFSFFWRWREAVASCVQALPATGGHASRFVQPLLSVTGQMRWQSRVAWDICSVSLWPSGRPSTPQSTACPPALPTVHDPRRPFTANAQTTYPTEPFPRSTCRWWGWGWGIRDALRNQTNGGHRGNRTDKY